MATLILTALCREPCEDTWEASISRAFCTRCVARHTSAKKWFSLYARMRFDSRSPERQHVATSRSRPFLRIAPNGLSLLDAFKAYWFRVSTDRHPRVLSFSTELMACSQCELLTASTKSITSTVFRYGSLSSPRRQGISPCQGTLLPVPLVVGSSLRFFGLSPISLSLCWGTHEPATSRYRRDS